MEYTTFVVSPTNEQNEINIAIAHIRGAASATVKKLSYGEELRITVCTDLSKMQVTVHTPKGNIVFSKETTPDLNIFGLRAQTKRKFLEQLEQDLEALGFQIFSDSWGDLTTYTQKVVKLPDYELPEDIFLYEKYGEKIGKRNTLVTEALKTIENKIELASKVSDKGESIQIIITNTFPVSVCIASHGVEIAAFPAPKNLPTPKIFNENEQSQLYFKDVLSKKLRKLGFCEIYDYETNSTSYTYQI